MYLENTGVMNVFEAEALIIYPVIVVISYFNADAFDFSYSQNYIINSSYFNNKSL